MMSQSNQNTDDYTVWMTAPLFEIPCPFDIETGTLSLLEPAESDAETLRRQLLAGTYDKPYLISHDDLRTLHLSLSLIQSTMRISQPDALELIYTQKMMSFLLFYPRPKAILLLGLGGGSLAKYCYRHLPHCDITAVEINPHVIGFRQAFCIPEDNERFRIHCDDATRFIEHHNTRTDIVLLDAFDGTGIAPELTAPDFYGAVFDTLSPNGILVMNLAGDKAGYDEPRQQLAGIFDDRILNIKVRDGGNQIILAFKNPAFAPRWDSIQNQAKLLEQKLGLEFTRFARHLEKSSVTRHLSPRRTPRRR